jgi:hypothetical protein
MYICIFGIHPRPHSPRREILFSFRPRNQGIPGVTNLPSKPLIKPKSSNSTRVLFTPFTTRLLGPHSAHITSSTHFLIYTITHIRYTHIHFKSRRNLASQV